MNERAFAETTFWQKLFNRRMLICIFTGFISGLPLYVLYQLIPAWLRTEGIDLATIGLFALVGFPYTWKFVWSPILDRFVPPFLWRRRGWMLVTQVTLLILIASFAAFNPQDNLLAIIFLVAGIAFFSASQDIVIDAYRREILPDDELGVGNSYFMNAYKLSSLVPGSLAFVLADIYPWPVVNLVVASFMVVGIVTTLIIDESSQEGWEPKTLRDAVINPFVEFFSRREVGASIAILLFMLLYKLGDNMATALETPFFIDLGFSMTQIGVIAKISKLWAAIFGSIVGGVVMIKLGINRSLWVFGFVQILTILGYVALSIVGPDEFMLFVAVSLEYIGVGLGGVALLAFISRLCNLHFTATQFALLSSLVAVPRTFANASTGFIIEAVGYTQFFWICFFAAIPGMLMLLKVAPWNAPDDTRS